MPATIWPPSRNEKAPGNPIGSPGALLDYALNLTMAARAASAASIEPASSTDRLAPNSAGSEIVSARLFARLAHAALHVRDHRNGHRDPLALQVLSNRRRTGIGEFGKGLADGSVLRRGIRSFSG